MTNRLSHYVHPTERRIMEIRTAAGGSSGTCCTCTRNAALPYRVVVDGKIVQGCIDAIHGPYITADDLKWHDRIVASTMREQELARLTRSYEGGI